MEIVVLVKAVPEGEARLRPDVTGTEVDPEGVRFVLAGYDESAVEEALLLKEANPGSSVHAISLGPAARAEEVLRATLALGADRATAVEAPEGISHDPLLVARALALAVGRGPCDLLLLGKQSSDSQSGVLPALLGALLGRPDLAPVVGLRFDAAAGRFEARISGEAGETTVAAPAPIVVGLQQAANDPRTAKLPMILRSRKAPIGRIPKAEVEAALAAAGGRRAVAPTAFRLPPPRTGARLIDYTTPEEAAEKLVRILGEEAKVLP